MKNATKATETKTQTQEQRDEALRAYLAECERRLARDGEESYWD